MTDLRARLAEALLAQFNMFPTLVNAKKLRLGALSDHLADVLLSLPGIAIVEIPAPDSTRYEGDFHEPADRLCWMPGDDFEVSVWNKGEIQRFGLGWGDLEPISATEARTVAAALLAAANAAEGAS